MSTDIAIHCLHLAYHDQVLFHDLHFNLAKGKLTCLLGPSGVGKSSLLRFIAGLEVGTKPPIDKNQISYLAQTDLLLPWFNVLDNVLIGARLRGQLAAANIQHAKTLLTEVGLSNAEKKYPRQLSGGMRQRAALVRTLLEDRPIVLMDEPFSAVDAITRFQLQALAIKLLKDRTVLLVTHDPFEALRMADNIYVLSGSPATLTLAAQLHTNVPRDLHDPELLQYQASLFDALVRAKEVSQ